MEFGLCDKMFDLEQLWLSRKDVRLENMKIIAQEIMKCYLRHLLMCLSEAVN